MRERKTRLTPTERRPNLRWSEGETNRLIRLWEANPNEWGKIERLDDASEDPQLANRSQVDMKDKMRNVKAALLRDGFKLPEIWVLVKLSVSQKRSLTNLY